jgi:hypothetical protein
MISNTPYFKFIQATILKELDEAESHVIVAVAWLTDPVLYHKLYSLCRKGKIVELLLNYDQINLSSGLDFEKIQEAGGKIFWEYEHEKRLMHNKYCIIDAQTIITGSYNWTNRAKSHNENIIVIKEDYATISSFKNEFYRLTNQTGRISTDTYYVKKYSSAAFANFQSFLEWWEISHVELKIPITERLFKKKFNFYTLPSENEYNLLLNTTALDLEFTGNLLLDYKLMIQEQFNDYNSLQAEYGYALSGLDGIEHFIHLEYLNCSWNDIVNLSPLIPLKKLSYLDLSHNGRMQCLLFNAEIDLGPLKFLQNLEYLNLLSNKSLKNFDALYYLKSLKTLDLSETNATKDEINNIKRHLPNCEILTDSVQIDDTEYGHDESDFSGTDEGEYDDSPF